MKKNNLDLFSPRANTRTHTLRFSVTLVIIVLSLSALVFYIKGLILNSDNFRVVDIIYKEYLNDGLSYLKGKNIFALNLNKESQRLLAIYPAFKKIRMIRILPNKIYLDFVQREPLAVVRLYRDFYIDENSVLFNAAELPLQKNLPVILGLERKIFAPKTGKSYNNAVLTMMLNIIREAKYIAELKNYQIRQIDVTSFKDITVLIEGGPQIRISQENFTDKMKVLAGLVTAQGGLDKIKYIDLRFNDPVIKFKDAE